MIHCVSFLVMFGSHSTKGPTTLFAKTLFYFSILRAFKKCTICMPRGLRGVADKNPINDLAIKFAPLT